MKHLKQEAVVVAGLLVWASTFLVELASATSSTARQLLVFLMIAGLILACAFRAIHHAEALGQRFGEPYDTLILTFSLLTIEVSLLASVMLTGSPDPTLARDTMFAGIMLSLNAVVGVVLLVGGFKYGQQEFNLEGARAYLAALTPLAVISLVLPRLTLQGDGALTSAQAIGLSTIIVLFYIVFLSVQTMRHRSFFSQIGGVPGSPPAHSPEPMPAAPGGAGIACHFALLLVVLVVIALLGKEIAGSVDRGIHRAGLPAAIGGMLVAVLTLTPESISAFRAAMADRLQHSVNVFLGGALATIGLTVPCALVIGLYTNQPITLGLRGTDTLLLLLTLYVSSLTFSGVRTNVLQGAVHLLLFATYVLLIFAP
ncbi:MAG: calcium:proton antiporter [Hyphomicrobiaceae bacterium]|nr:calcium:proton antiporter [Hyphomicrobiaceae bacterium]